jgi:hypothetical protein
MILPLLPLLHGLKLKGVTHLNLVVLHKYTNTIQDSICGFQTAISGADKKVISQQLNGRRSN